MSLPGTGFRGRLHSREKLLGTFIKTPTPHAIEILGALRFDFVVIDAEHGPFDRCTLDTLLLASRAAGIPALVRVPDIAAILPALDLGAAGVLVPHVNSEASARAAVEASRHVGGTRGFCNTARAGDFGGKSLTEHIRQADESVAVIAMIEDERALKTLDAIAGTPGLDALFIGRGDLAAGLGLPGMHAPEIRQACLAVAGAAQRASLSFSAAPISPDDANWLVSLGANAMIISSDQGLLRQAAISTLENYRNVTGYV